MILIPVFCTVATHTPICIAGKRAAPPEDCGGSWRYSEILHHIKYRTFEYDEMMEDWIYRDFDPEAFDRMAVKADDIFYIDKNHKIILAN